MNPACRAIVLFVILSVFLVAGRCPAGEPRFTDLRGEGLFQSGNGYSESIDMLFDVRQGGDLWLGTTNGSVHIKTWAKDQIRLVVTKTTAASSPFNARTILENFLVQARHQGKNLQLTGEAHTETCRNSVGVTFTVWVPRNYNVAVNTGDGDVDIGKINGSFSAKTAKGKITFECEPNGMDIEVEDNTGRTDEKPAAQVEGAEGTGPVAGPSSPDLKKVDIR